ncbi:hypothetical protein [Pseudoroseicyclus sp. CXY001]|uniref:hypothetical protein n=1 Tax=Pseudoroseicyclus sp. CXY001 TaxID=3242492 RepID=UPI003570CD64
MRGAALLLALAACTRGPMPEAEALGLTARLIEAGPHAVEVEARVTNGAPDRICVLEPPPSDAALRYLRLHDEAGRPLPSFIGAPFAPGTEVRLAAVEPGATLPLRLTAPLYVLAGPPAGWSVMLEAGPCPAVLVVAGAAFNPGTMAFESLEITTPVAPLP